MPADTPDDSQPETDPSGEVVKLLIAVYIKELYYASWLLCFGPARWPY